MILNLQMKLKALPS